MKESLHGGHFDIRRSPDQMMRRGYWVCWRRFVERFCNQCPVCNQVHREEPPKQGQLKPLLANGPIDRCVKFSRSDGNAWILTVLGGYFSKVVNY
jgi:Integrase zinc binding domain